MEVEKSTLHNLKEIGRKNQTYDQLIRQRITCDAAGCNAAGSHEIKVNAGKFGTITLFVCANCIGKFEDDNKAVGPAANKAQQQQDRRSNHQEANLNGNYKDSSTVGY